MSEMKMSDKFRLPVFYECDPLSEVAKFSAWHGDGEICKSLFLAFDDCDADLICKAINNHDRMVEEIAELRGALKLLIGKGVDLLNVEDVSDEEDAASVHANFNDAIIKSEQLLAKLNQEGEE